MSINYQFVSNKRSAKHKSKHRHTDIQTVNTQTYKHADIQAHIHTGQRHTDIPTHRHTGTQTYRHTDMNPTDHMAHDTPQRDLLTRLQSINEV